MTQMELIESVRVLVRVAMMRTGNVVSAEDVTQDATLSALKAFRKKPHVEHPRAFLMKVVEDVVRDHWRVVSRHRLENLDDLDERFAARHPTLEEDLDRRGELATLRTAIRQLGGERRAVITLFYIEGYHVEEIARIYNKRPEAIRMTLVRGRRELKEIVRWLTNKSREGRDIVSQGK